MGIETALLAMGASASTAATVGTIGTIASAGLSLVSGIQGMSEGKSQAKQMYAQTSANIAEQTRQATRGAYNEKQAAETARRQQKIAYLASGVSLSGSPLAVLEETRQRGASNAAEVLAANEAYTKGAGMEGSASAKNLVSSGRSQFIKGVTGALTTYANK